MDAAGFRLAFPAFHAERFPDARVAFWLTVGGKRLSAERFGDLLDEALCLYAAHELTLERAAALDTSGAGGMSAAAGPAAATSKAVGSVSKSVSFSPGATQTLGAGRYNATIYGQQLHELMRLLGAGGMVV